MKTSSLLLFEEMVDLHVCQLRDIETKECNSGAQQRKGSLSKVVMVIYTFDKI